MTTKRYLPGNHGNEEEDTTAVIAVTAATFVRCRKSTDSWERGEYSRRNDGRKRETRGGVSGNPKIELGRHEENGGKQRPIVDRGEWALPATNGLINSAAGGACMARWRAFTSRRYRGRRRLVRDLIETSRISPVPYTTYGPLSPPTLAPLSAPGQSA